ncbi:MAG: hypothetical protein C5B50_06055 [Verrucomicrobia bacterium]|nr:MAG: hypothetical protein C5B50_06055 [Verrucomicrobiota bacterium]
MGDFSPEAIFEPGGTLVYLKHMSFEMRGRSRITVVVSASLVVCGVARAITPAPPTNNYGAIPERNVFGLKPSPGIQQPMLPPKTVPQIILTGITTLLGNKLALLKAILPPRPGEAPREQNLTLAEGQREGYIEVLEVDEKAGRVKVDDFGTITNLTFERNGPKLAPAMPSAPAPTIAVPPTAAAGTSGAPAAMPYVPPPNITAGMQAMPSRALRGLVAVPPAPVTNYPAPTQPQPQQPLTPEEQALLLQLEQAANTPQPGPPPVYSTNLAVPVPVLPGVLPPGANTQRPSPPLMPQ